MNETKTYADGTSATGQAPLPDHSPDGAPEVAPDLPGMLGVARGVALGEWPHTTDARKWVDEWMKHIAANPEIPTDRGAMVAWFANAIMAGYDDARAIVANAARR